MTDGMAGREVFSDAPNRPLQGPVFCFHRQDFYGKMQPLPAFAVPGAQLGCIEIEMIILLDCYSGCSKTLPIEGRFFATTADMPSARIAERI